VACKAYTYCLSSLAFVPSNPFKSKKSEDIKLDAEDAMNTSPPSNDAGTYNPELTPAGKNANLDSFEAVMQAMDKELGRLRNNTSTGASAPSADTKGKGKAKAEEEEEDIEAAMEAELKAALENGDDEDAEEAGMDYNLIKNFLESFKSQAGLSGPVGNLAGRLQPDWKLPRDDS
jgi:hypothetical protein